MKVSRFIVIALVALLVIQGLAISAFAGPPAGTWISGIQVQNVSTAQAANITVTFYWAAGTAQAGQKAYEFTDTIPAGKAVAYYVPNIVGVPANFVGSVVVSSDVEVAAVLNTSKNSTGVGTDTKRVGTAVGVKDPSTTVYAPLLRKNFYQYNSYIAVQNTASTTATVAVNYTDSAGTAIPAARQTANVPPFSTKIFYQNDNTLLPNGFWGSAVITGTQPLATVINVAAAGSSAATAGFESYNGFGSGATKLYLPKLTVNYYGYQGGFTIQNTGNAPATMAITYRYGANVYTKVSPLIQPGQAWGVFLATTANSGLPGGLSGVGSGVVTSAQPMVAIVSERNDTYGIDFASQGVADGSGTSTVLIPKFDSRFYDYDGGIQIQNLGTTTTTLRATFSMQGRTDKVVTSPPVGPGSSYAWYGPNVVPALGNGFVGSVVVVSLNSQPIAGVYTSRNVVLTGDSAGAYNGIQK